MDVLRQVEIKVIESDIGYTFKDKSLLEKAFTHSTVANLRHLESNERLEFLGDSILSFIVSEKLYNNLNADEGKLSHIRSQIVSAKNLARIVDDLKLSQVYNRHAQCELSVNVKCDLFESLLAAIYIDGGLAAATKFVESNIDLSAQAVTTQKDDDFKSPLQAYLQAHKIANYCYKIISQSGLAHKPTFEVALYVNGSLVCTGKGGSRQKAEQKCAQQALEILPSCILEISAEKNVNNLK